MCLPIRLPHVNLSGVVGSSDLVLGAQSGQRLGMSREAVRLWVARERFPAPHGRVDYSVLRDWASILVWSREGGRAAPRTGQG